MKSKKNYSMSKLVSLVLSVIMLSTPLFNSYAQDNILNEENNVSSTKSDTFDNTISTIERELEKENTTINEQLNHFIEEDLKYFSPEEAKMIKDGINSNRPEDANKVQPRAYMPDYTFDPTATDMAIANAAIAYFKYHKYNLSAHLLSRGLHVRSSQKYVVPDGVKDFLYRTEAYRGLCNGNRYRPGNTYSAQFQNLYNRDEADAYYAIRKFRAEITESGSRRRINIMDRYDFHEGSDSGAAGIAINAIARLQSSGYFVPYNIVIPLVRNVTYN